MSFISKLKSPLMKRHLMFHDNNHLENDKPKRNLIIYHIDATDNEGTLSLDVNNSDIGDVLLNKVCDHYNLNDYKEYFGLKYTLSDEKGNYEILWLDPLKLIGTQLKHANNTLTFRVKHFPAHPHKIESADVRYLIFLQLKAYLQKGELQLPLNDEITLASYVLQSEYGDFDEEIYQNSNKNYLKDKILISKKNDKNDESIIELHKNLVGFKPEDAEYKFLEHVSQFNTYGAEILMVKNKQSVPINFGVSHRGIITYLHGTPANIARIELYPWSQIGKISYENKSLHIHAHTPEPTNSEIFKKHSMIFKCNSERMCKHLWKFILDQKAFFTFNRGIEVPKFRSSKRIFGRTSKFRYSGRCENEILVSQTDLSQNSSLNQSLYSTLHRRPKKQFKIIPSLPSTSNLKINNSNNSEKSFNDSGLSENYVETLGILQETSSINEQQINKMNEPLHVDIDDDHQLQNIPPSSNEKPTATSTPQIKKEEELPIIPIITITQEFEDKIDDNLNEKLLIVDTPSTPTIETTKINININKRRIQWRTILNIFLVIFIISIIFIFILPALIGGGNSLYSTVKNILTSSVNSVSVSVKDNLRNSQLLFDPIFSFFLRNYQPDI